MTRAVALQNVIAKGETGHSHFPQVKFPYFVILQTHLFSKLKPDFRVLNFGSPKR